MSRSLRSGRPAQLHAAPDANPLAAALASAILLGVRVRAGELGTVGRRMNARPWSFVTTFAVVPAIFALSITWMLAALQWFESRSGRHRPDLIGTNHTPNYDFIYYPGGRRIEFWSLDLPAYVFAGLALALVIWCFTEKRFLGWWRVTAATAYAAVFAIALFAVGIYVYFTAVSIFI
jgi:hypothetical protein